VHHRAERGVDHAVARHRMIYAALGPMMHQQIHALAIRAYAPDEAETLSQP
jgi:BolA protein